MSASRLVIPTNDVRREEKIPLRYSVDASLATRQYCILVVSGRTGPCAIRPERMINRLLMEEIISSHIGILSLCQYKQFEPLNSGYINISLVICGAVVVIPWWDSPFRSLGHPYPFDDFTFSISQAVDLSKHSRV